MLVLRPSIEYFSGAIQLEAAMFLSGSSHIKEFVKVFGNFSRYNATGHWNGFWKRV